MLPQSFYDITIVAYTYYGVTIYIVYFLYNDFKNEFKAISHSWVHR